MSTVTAGRASPVSRRRRPRTLSRALWSLSLAALLALGAVFAFTDSAVSDARGGLKVIGHGAGPQAIATADLYYALSDMDVQIAGILLLGRERNLGIGRDQAMSRYEQDRDQADRAALQAAELAGSDPAGQRSVRFVLYSLGRYERLTDQAVVLDDQSGHPAGPAPQNVISIYRQAAAVMKVDLLPGAYNLTLDAGSVVRHGYLVRRDAVLAGRIPVAVAGGALIALLAGLQVLCAARFRRLINPALLLATLGAAALLATTLVLLTDEAEHLTAAKTSGFDATLALSRARALGNRAVADESRYLLDPGHADIDTETYLDESQAVLYVPADSIGQYDAAIGPAVAAGTGFLGFLGDEARGTPVPGGRGALASVLAAYQRFQRDDRQMRALGSRRDATAVKVGVLRSDFDLYDAALVSLTARHQAALTSAIRAGDDELGGWSLLPVAVLALAAVVIGGVAPRLWEFH
ncbi:MAG: hypothetical protein JWN00_5843 [Actinomycetia bacterium]|nr:hypothetical protein [Actinomycetes bacterium]